VSVIKILGGFLWLTNVFFFADEKVSHYAIKLSTGETITSAATVCAIGSTIDCHTQLAYWAEDAYHKNNQLLHCHDLIQLIKAKNSNYNPLFILLHDHLYYHHNSARCKRQDSHCCWRWTYERSFESASIACWMRKSYFDVQTLLERQTFRFGLELASTTLSHNIY